MQVPRRKSVGEADQGRRYAEASPAARATALPGASYPPHSLCFKCLWFKNDVHLICTHIACQKIFALVIVRYNPVLTVHLICVFRVKKTKFKKHICNGWVHQEQIIRTTTQRENRLPGIFWDKLACFVFYADVACTSTWLKQEIVKL